MNPTAQSFAREPAPTIAAPLWPENPLRIPDDADAIPRLETWHLHSQALPDPGYRPILVYLPEQYYSEPHRRFPVFYLHDGQNLFDGRTSYVAGRTWQAHTAADNLNAAGEIEPVILVGIANTGTRRMAEYTPTRDPKMGGGEGRKYGRLLIDELKPFIDRTYRTRTGPHDTGLGGSSLGGLISLFLGLEHPSVFGKLAVMSPSIWWDHRSILNSVNQAHPRPDLRIWLDMGTAEGARHVRDTDHLHRLLLRLGWQEGKDLAYTEAPGAVHDEAAWAQRFPNALRFLFPND
ncbi:alpha/beta hydrolase [Granulicella arctica]|uniref:Putative alpha/beta superfamily hydrolase n=1 Tax=Granulicella arctica TaxID=940613 RepID=A0A7Y9PJX8_9BACT|nr:alpha/beta hydrolase-fold protein [Granulicella arctica]NYF80541.1 putative alpha/beta superfamily hydrolase [Granulicella arctica]